MKLGDKIKLIGGGTPSKDIPEYWNGSIPWVSVKDFKSEIINSTVNQITEVGLQNSVAKLVKEGTLLISTRMAVGKTAIAGIDLTFNQDIKAIESSNDISTTYLHYFLKSKQKYFDSVSSGATVKGIKIQDIINLEINFPPLTEQKRIADLLDAADQLRLKDKALLEKYDQLAQSLFLEMFGENNSNNEVELGTIIKLIGGGTPSKDVEEYWNGNIPWASVKDLKSDILSSTIDHISELGLKNSVSKIIPAGSVIISTRMAVGKAVICKQDTAINQDLKGVKIIGNLNELYLLNLLKSKEEYFQSVSSGATVKGIKIEHITKLKVSLPEISLQNKFAEQIQLIEQQKELAKKNLEKSEELFGSLMGEVFGG